MTYCKLITVISLKNSVFYLSMVNTRERRGKSFTTISCFRIKKNKHASRHSYKELVIITIRQCDNANFLIDLR